MGDIQGIICSLFFQLWGAAAIIYVYLLFDPLRIAAEWAAGSVAMGIFLRHIFCGSLHRLQGILQDTQDGGAIEDCCALR